MLCYLFIHFRTTFKVALVAHLNYHLFQVICIKSARSQSERTSMSRKLVAEY